MIDEIKKSVNSVMYERVKSPLFGTFILSWVFWNWRIFYISFFVSEKSIPNKLDFIHKYLYNHSHLIWYPAFSTFILITIVPFVNNGAYLLHIKFKKWRIDQRNEIEKKQLLTIEQSILLREQIKNQEDRFQTITSEKDNEIKILKLELSELNKKLSLVKTESDFTVVDNKEINSTNSKAIAIENRAKKIFTKLTNEHKVHLFKDYVSNSLNQIPMVKDEPSLSEFVTLGLFNLSADNGLGKFYYDVTDLGDKVKEMAFML